MLMFSKYDNSLGFTMKVKLVRAREVHQEGII